MAPVQMEPQIRYAPIAVAASHLAAAVSLTSIVGRGLYRSFVALGPAQSTHPRRESRARLVPVFSALAGLGLLLASYSTASYAVLSYRVWADQRGIGQDGESSAGLLTSIHLTSRWLSDTPVYRDALEIVAEKARRFWWGQQIDLGLASWSLLLAIEGRRRRIPYLWAYLSLAHLVSLSFAQNLFFVALLLTPVPLQEGGARVSWLARAVDRAFPPKPTNWCPFPALFLGVLIVNLGAIASLPSAAGTSLFGVATGASRGLSFAVLALPTVVPASWGTVHAHPHDAYSAYTKMFRLLSFAGLCLHGKATLLGLLYNAPDSQHHRHSVRIPFDTTERSTWERTTTPLGKVLGSTADHPVVAAIGRDVLLSALSLGLWAAVRALDARSVLNVSSWPLYRTTDAGEVTNGSIANASSGTSPDQQSPPLQVVKAESTEPPSPVRKRGRPRKINSAAAAAAENESVLSSSPTESKTPARRRGRPRKIKQDPDEATADASYEPSPAEAASIAEGDVVPLDGLDWEAAALVWGITAAGGLGCGSAGVFGGECVSR